MNQLNVSLGERSYPIFITEGFGQIGKVIEAAGVNGKLALITDTNVDRCQSEPFIKALKAEGMHVLKHVIDAGERNKNLDTVKGIYGFLTDARFDRDSALIALGGGVVGDITGFAAATYLRGVNFMQVPTTTLAQADSSVGGKVGVDFGGYKNLVGAFFQPKLVYINVRTLCTLPVREFKSGLSEIIKHGIIADSRFFEYIESSMEKILTLDVDALQYMAAVNCGIKSRVVEKDEKESGMRAILNFGHTIGHAVESAAGFELLHGECVSIGMVGAFKLAQHLGMIDMPDLKRVTALLEKAGLPVYAVGIDAEEVYRRMYYDKKVRGNKLTFVLPKGIGEVVQHTIDDEKLLRAVIDELIR